MNEHPDNSAPGGMSGATRMHDPSEAAHDRVRRRVMNVAFVIIALLNVAQLRGIGVHGWDWLRVLLLALAAAPSGVVVKIFELRFKMAVTERRQVLRDLPARTEVNFIAYAVLVTVVYGLNGAFATWALAGIWLYDFTTYYHDRPERMRHLYAVTKTLDELREFRAPWAWTLPALAFAMASRLLERQ
jgi:hypothetical protein